MKANQIKYQGVVNYPYLQALLDFIISVQDISPQIYTFFVAFCRDPRLRTSVFAIFPQIYA